MPPCQGRGLWRTCSAASAPRLRARTCGETLMFLKCCMVVVSPSTPKRRRTLPPPHTPVHFNVSGLLSIAYNGMLSVCCESLSSSASSNRGFKSGYCCVLLHLTSSCQVVSTKAATPAMCMLSTTQVYRCCTRCFPQQPHALSRNYFILAMTTHY